MNHLISDELRKIQAFLSAWLDFSSGGAQADLSLIKSLLSELYADMGLGCPQVIFCQGPLQQALLPALSELMLRHEEVGSRELGFQATALEPPLVRQEWRKLWNECAEAIDWSRQQRSPGPIINNRVGPRLERTLRSHLIAELDQCLGAERHHSIEKLFDSELSRPHSQLRRAIMFSNSELSNIWRAFLMRLPEPLKGYVRDRSPKEDTAQDEQKLFTNAAPNQNAWMGTWDWYWLASSEFAVEQLSCRLSADLQRKLELWCKLSKEAVSYLFCHNFCFVYLRPLEISFDPGWRLHNSDAAAVEFADGTRSYFWHGVEVPSAIILKPRKIRMKAIEAETNIELKRIMIERYGLDNFIRYSRTSKIHEDEFGVLYSRSMGEYEEPVVAVQVTNSTPEPDGTHRVYFVRVPPEMTTARQAVAWTFGLPAHEYAPEQET